MDARTAKREACHRAANVLETAMAEGWLSAPADGSATDADVQRVSDGVEALIKELRRRSAGSGR